MKKLSDLKLNKLGQAQLREREMNCLRGGDSYNCGCGCHYEGQQYGATTLENQNSNAERSYSSYGGSKYCWHSDGPGLPFVQVAAFN